MSKLGRMSIDCSEVTISVSGNIISYKGKHASGNYTIPEFFESIVEGSKLTIKPRENSLKRKSINMQWGLHRALLNNAIMGARVLFEKQIRIEGLGFKAQLQGNTLVFALGFSHKKECVIPKEVSVEIDKTGQILTCRSHDKMILGQLCSDIRSLRPPEPYKGKGIRYANEVILRKDGKAKS
jgi:large subunit ribosomal protein L6